MVRVLATIAGIALIVVVLVDAFETVVLPRRVTRRLRLVRLFYRVAWRFWRFAVQALIAERRQENYLSYFGPLSLPALLVVWALVLITGFGLLYWAPGNALKTPEGGAGIGACLYFSGTTFFTLGLGDISPHTPFARFVIVLESGMGFAFLALVISYLPALNASFSRREVNISLLDARAGSPPTAAEMLRRHADRSAQESLIQLLHGWERWSAELFESHLSYPVLVYFRSQHDNQSWLAALTAVLDASAFLMTNGMGPVVRQAQLTFAMARHAIVDLALVLRAAPQRLPADRLPGETFSALYDMLTAEGMELRKGHEGAFELTELRRTYEPYLHALSLRLRLTLPPWMLARNRRDNWQLSITARDAGLRKAGKPTDRDEEHF